LAATTVRFGDFAEMQLRFSDAWALKYSLHYSQSTTGTLGVPRPGELAKVSAGLLIANPSPRQFCSPAPVMKE
jgi:hypothetical protein